MIVVEGVNRAAAPKGSMTYAFAKGNFLLLLLLLLLLRPLRYGPGGWEEGGDGEEGKEGGKNSPYV